jgi:hypothetical protein
LEDTRQRGGDGSREKELVVSVGSSGQAVKQEPGLSGGDSQVGLTRLRAPAELGPSNKSAPTVMNVATISQEGNQKQSGFTFSMHAFHFSIGIRGSRAWWVEPPSCFLILKPGETISGIHVCM